MPKTNSKTKSKSLTDSSLETQQNLNKLDSVSKASWSDWIWWEEECIYYRGKLQSETKVWRYEYTAGLDTLITKVLPQQTKKDIDLKAIYAPAPIVVHDISDSSAVVSNYTNEQAIAVEVETENTKIEEGVEANGKKEKEHGGRQKSSTSWKQRKSKVQNYERIVAYLESIKKEEKERLKSRKGRDYS